MKGRPIWRRPCVVILGALIGMGTSGVGPALAALSDPVPPRPSGFWPGGAPWPGFRPGCGGEEFAPPMQPVADPARWKGWLFGSTESGSRDRRVRQPMSPRPGPAPAETSRSFLDRETREFRASWKRALAAALRGDAKGTRRALETSRPQTVGGTWRARRLLFAVAVAEGDRAAADSLFYRISWSDAGRTATRLAAWRALERRDGDRAARLLEVIPDPEPGERAALAMARWMDNPGVPDTTRGRLRTAQGDSGPAGVVLRLAEARNALLQGDTARAGRLLQAATPVPEPWMDLKRGLSRLAGSGPAGEEGEVAFGGEASLRDAVQDFLAGRDSQAEARLDSWLAVWPDSPHRSEAYLLRGWLRLAAGKLDEADEDLRIARDRGRGGIAERARLVRSFVLARRGEFDRARSLFRRVFEGDLGLQAEAELLFDRIRLARLESNPTAAREVVLRLEEEFPDGPWPGRARADTLASAWGQPWRTAPPESSPVRRPPVPEGNGPWEVLLWGPAILPRTARDLGQAPSPMSSPAPLKPSGSVPSPAPTPGGTPGTRGFVSVFAGAPVALAGEGGMGGGWKVFRYRAAAKGVAGGQRNGLPEFRRLQWEGGLGASPGKWRLDLTGLGNLRRDDEASGVGLLDERVDAWWRGVRLDAAYGNAAGDHLAVFGSWTAGQVDPKTPGSWRREEAWLGADAGLHMRGTRWRGRLRTARMDHRSPGRDSFERTYQDLRLVRLHGEDGYLGLRATLYNRRGLLLPVARWKTAVGKSWTAWVGTEPALEPSSFRKGFVADGDWNVPDFTLQGERRYLDLRGGVEWRGATESRFAATAGCFRSDHFRSWRRDHGLWVESAVDEVTGVRGAVSAEIRSGGFQAGGRVEAQDVTSGGNRVPFVPRLLGNLELKYSLRGWRWQVRGFAVEGRRGEDGKDYGSFLRWDVETAYRWRQGNLPFGARWLEMTLRVQNVTDVADRRWPGVPGYGVGVYGGVRAVYGAD